VTDIDAGVCFCVHFSTADGFINMNSTVNGHTRTALQCSVAVVLFIG
jgi:hypothetical protein